MSITKSPAELYELGMSVREVAKEAGYSYAGMRERLQREGVILRPGGGSKKGSRRKLDDEKMYHLYHIEGKSTLEIASDLGFSVAGVTTSLHRFGTPLRNNGGRRTFKVAGFEPNKEWILEVMPRFGGSVTEASKAYGVSYSTWISWMERFGIPRRSRSESLTGRVSTRKITIPLEEAIELSNNGTTYTELSIRYNVSYAIVAKRLKEAGHTPPKRSNKRESKFKTASYHKRKILEELDITDCEVCGETRAFDFSHIFPAKLGGPLERENCLVLCPTHHRLYDAGKLTKQEFTLVRTKVRLAEKKYDWTNPFYGGW